MRKDLKKKEKKGRSGKVAQLVMELATKTDNWLLRTNIRRTISKMLSSDLNNMLGHRKEIGE